MSNTKNHRDLKEIGQSLCELSKVLKKTESSDNFSKIDFSKLDRKLFSEVIYFLLVAVDPDLVKKLTWPVVNQPKLHAAFVKDVFQAVNVIKERYPYCNTKLLQFQNVRPENDKIVEFLKQLLNVAIFIVTKTEPGQQSKEELRKEIQSNYECSNQIRENLRLAEVHKNEVQSELDSILTAYESLKDEFKQKGFLLDESETWSQDEILKYCENYERKLLDCIKSGLKQ